MNNLRLATLLMATNLISGNDSFYNESVQVPKKKKELKKCLFCGKDHKHKNSFCCAEHCKEYNKRK